MREKQKKAHVIILSEKSLMCLSFKVDIQLAKLFNFIAK